MSERMSITSKQASIHRYCPERCVAFQLHHGLQALFFLVFYLARSFAFCRVAILLLLTSYDDDGAYDMKLGGLFLLRCFCFI